METYAENYEEKRQSFRVDDELELHYEIVSPETVNINNLHKSSNLVHPKKYLYALHALEQDTQATIKILKDNTPELIPIIKIINQKFDLLSNILECMIDEKYEEAVTQKVNLSHDGLAFIVNEHINPGSFLKITLLLKPSYRDIETYAKVVYCNPLPESSNSAVSKAHSYRLALTFVSMTHVDNQAFSRHLMLLQTNARKKQLIILKKKPDCIARLSVRIK